jgi:hypothetical protein
MSRDVRSSAGCWAAPETGDGDAETDGAEAIAALTSGGSAISSTGACGPSDER